jgi:hypothetical protein
MKNHHHNHPAKPTANSRSVIHDAIACRAYEIWERDGRPENQAETCWLEAEVELATGRSVPKADKLLPVSF